MAQKSQEKNNELMNEFEIFSHPVPELDLDDIKMANDIDNKAWIISHMGKDNVGKFGFGMEMGFALQCVKPDVLRCIFCFDDGPAIKNLSMVKLTVEALGGQLEIGDYTITREFEGHDDEDSVPSEPAPLGMEVA